MIETEAAARAWLATLPEFDSQAQDRLDLLVKLTREENQRQNLVSAGSLEHVWTRHIVDSAQLLRFVPRETSSPWMDLGTGAGFPGLVIAALRPECEVVMVESRTRRVEWLQRAADAMGLRSAKVIGARLETIPSAPRACISARAFAPLGKLLNLSARFSTSDTVWVLPKGMSAQQELDNLRNWRHTFHVEHSVTDPQAGIIVGTLTGGKGSTT
ncbi:16S rRNA (guanine(527)-N(7))-methyltransferase RsmG [Novosphingobium sp. Leaf2]|uniref:16S rRNA (guanine(527)-N(7))-methyltransferase RsmG n=1 Tax=Novosphingobium sp. Leaf2 TaxID=1735670 RepID=UPI0006F3F477|nr:16S rRNA (guanine(527)-N(7))-methyltransferase RsmG [Novosphingobium sp. Leaf2]KQM21848.1 16S rRNA (guanine(527)-N(7))-methyltransferase RsmG [Novosphingobium sp. Leaf2]